ncbi:GNAT family N-acetyltransferase [Patescibacteria group bacterium]|nr:MAG: GNAT family N-acetyltransferase [Patescibacteria group bacterium]
MIEYQLMRGQQDLQEGDLPCINALIAALTKRNVRTSRDRLITVMYRAQLIVARDISQESCSPIIGMATMNLVTTPYESYGSIDGVAVLPSHEGHGVGTTLVERLIEQGRNLGLSFVELTSGRGANRARANHVYRDKLKGELRDTNVYRWKFWADDER